MNGVTLTHIGGPTALIEIAGWRLLTDPTFDPPGGHYKFGWGTASDKLAGPSVSPDEIGRVDAVLLSHDHHDDNLDELGRELLDRAETVITTASGASRLGRDARGLSAWDQTTLSAPGKSTITVTATPCRHGPPLSRPIVGDVVGFALAWDEQADGVLWISGDTVLYPGVLEVADRLEVDTAILHLGGVRFPISGPIEYTLTAADAVKLVGAIRPRQAIPIHYEGWKHFRETRAEVERELAAAPSEISGTFRWVPIGEAEAL